MDVRRLELIEKYVVSYFQARRQTRILAKDLFDSTGEFPNGDIVRALEDLEKKQRLLVRHTTEGNDYVSLTPEGAALLNLEDVDEENDSPALPHPPKSATKGV
jgi:DNA-binding PadR family transcriptional regulator